MKYGFCINHPTRYAVNAKHLCAQCAKERNVRIALSKGFTIKKKDDGIDSTRRSETAFIATELYSKYSNESNDKSKINTKKTKMESMRKILKLE